MPAANDLLRCSEHIATPSEVYHMEVDFATKVEESFDALVAGVAGAAV